MIVQQIHSEEDILDVLESVAPDCICCINISGFDPRDARGRGIDLSLEDTVWLISRLQEFVNNHKED